jgi:DNA-binding transcriptional regulator YdaS (Cro superfamily)
MSASPLLWIKGCFIFSLLSGDLKMTSVFQQCVNAAGGTQKLLAKRLDLTEQAVGQWKHSRIPVKRVLQIEKELGIHRAVLRPDIYPP